MTARPTARREWLARVIPKSGWCGSSGTTGFCAAANAGIAAARGRFIQLLNNDTEVDRRLDRGGTGPIRRSAPSASVAPLVLVRSEPGRVDSAGDSYALVGWPTKRGHGQPGGLVCRAGRSRKSSAPAARVPSIAQRHSASPGASIRSSARITRTSISPFACAGPVIVACSLPDALIYHDVSATYDHRAPVSNAAWPGTPSSSSGPTFRLVYSRWRSCLI